MKQFKVYKLCYVNEFGKPEARVIFRGTMELCEKLRMFMKAEFWDNCGEVSTISIQNGGYNRSLEIFRVK